MLPPIKLLSNSPIQKIISFPLEEIPFFTPFGSSRALNVLDHFLGTPDVATQVLFLGSGDLRNALHMATHCSDAYPELDIHLSDDCNIVTARNFLMAHVMLSDSFDPSSPADLQYLWDLWYGLQWDDITRKRFVKDCKLLMERGLTNPSIIPHGGHFYRELSKILKSWLDTACNMNSKQIKAIIAQRQQFILDAGAIQATTFDKFMESKEQNPQLNLFSLENIAVMMAICTGNDANSASLINIVNASEIERFLRTGDFAAKIEKIVCLNPTLLTLDDKYWRVSWNVFPLDAYFPLSFIDRLEEKYQPGSSVYDYSKAKMQSLVTELRLRKERNRFHFYFGDSLELCLTNGELHNKMHVIHCSFAFVTYAGLANILSSVTCCLNGDIPEAIVVTEFSGSQTDIPPVINVIESKLFCPLTMIPTVYGLRLLDHIRLGSSVCYQLHDRFIAVVPYALKWIKAPVALSTNVRLDVSPALMKIVFDLMETCFNNGSVSRYFLEGKNYVRTLFFQSTYFRRNSPLTFYKICSPFFNRHNLVEGETESLTTQYIPAQFQLAWRALKDWMEGKQVLLFYNNSSEMRDAIVSTAENHLMEFAQVQFLLKPVASKTRLGQIASEDFFTDAHHIFNLNWKDSAEFAVSFFLPKDYGLGAMTKLVVIGAHDQKILHLTHLASQPIQQKEVANPSLRRFLLPSIPPNSVYDLRCQETEEEYKFKISMQRVKFESRNDCVVSCSTQMHSTHKFDLKLKKEENKQFPVQLPWPVLVKGIVKTMNADKSIQVILKKCVDDAWPGDHGGRSKWDINYLRPWRELIINGSLREHIEAQFGCYQLSLMKRCMNSPSPMTPLDEVRDIIRTVFYSHFNNKFQLMAIHSPTNPNVPVFFIRIHPPVRFSPHGSPLLLVSVIDYPRLEDLISQGRVDREQFQLDYHRLVTERVSKEVCIIRASTDEEVNLLRFYLRVNSTRMRRSAWQSKNLPRGEDTPWIATFISPIYAEGILENCSKYDENFNQLLTESVLTHCKTCPSSDPKFRKSCAFCCVTKVQLKMCTRCRVTFYCSPSCQKNHWLVHKSHCPRPPFSN